MSKAQCLLIQFLTEAVRLYRHKDREGIKWPGFCREQKWRII